MTTGTAWTRRGTRKLIGDVSTKPAPDGWHSSTTYISKLNFLPPDYIGTNKGETFLLWDPTYSPTLRRSLLFGTVDNLDIVAQAPNIIIDGTFSSTPKLFT